MGNLIFEGMLPPENKLRVGEKAIDFSLPGNNGGDWRLSDNL